jgi:hypothetical protein
MEARARFARSEQPRLAQRMRSMPGASRPQGVSANHAFTVRMPGPRNAPS